MDSIDTTRLAFFLGILVVIGAWEAFAPRLRMQHPKVSRWANNLGIVLIYVVLVHLIFPILPASMALIAGENGFGLFNSMDVSYWPSVIISVIILDLVVYLQHVMFHAVPVLWRFHMMHHADLDFDLSTGLRFHPIEIILSTVIKLAVVAALGPPVLAVVIFEVLLNGTALFNHGNIRIPLGMDRILRLFVVTPDMHRVHHSVIIRETNSNFGFNLPWWDRLLGTYRAQPARGHTGMTIGLSHIRDSRCLGLPGMLALPFTGSPGAYPLGRAAREP